MNPGYGYASPEENSIPRFRIRIEHDGLYVRNKIREVDIIICQDSDELIHVTIIITSPGNFLFLVI